MYGFMTLQSHGRRESRESNELPTYFRSDHRHLHHHGARAWRCLVLGHTRACGLETRGDGTAWSALGLPLVWANVAITTGSEICGASYTTDSRADVSGDQKPARGVSAMTNLTAPSSGEAEKGSSAMTSPKLTLVFLVLMSICAAVVYTVEDVAVWVEEPENKAIRIFHVRQLLAYQNSLIYPPIYPFLESNNPMRQFTPLGSEVAPRVWEIPGISSMNVGRYYVLVEKGGAFTWEEIISSVTKAIVDVLGEE
jgi:hypothetical protein